MFSAINFVRFWERLVCKSVGIEVSVHYPAILSEHKWIQFLAGGWKGPEPVTSAFIALDASRRSRPSIPTLRMPLQNITAVKSSNWCRTMMNSYHFGFMCCVNKRMGTARGAWESWNAAAIFAIAIPITGALVAGKIYAIRGSC